MLYTFTHYATLYELYVGILRGLIAVAVALSMLISLDRLYKVRGPALVHSFVAALLSVQTLSLALDSCDGSLLQVLVYYKIKLKTKLTGRRPEHEYSARPLPDAAAYSMVYPKVRALAPCGDE
jgi:hypothetical protein